MSTSSTHTKAFGQCCHGKHTVASSRTLLSDHVDACGKQSDGGTFSGSTLYQFLADFESTLPKSASFEGSGTEMPFFILGNKAYPLKTFLMKPLARKNISREEHVFNCRLSQARRCAECAFGVLIAKRRLLNKAIEMNVNKAERIVRCVCLLYNIIIDTERTTHNPSFLQAASQIHVSRQAKTNVGSRSFSQSSKVATDVRNDFKAHFNGPAAAILSQNQSV